MVKKECKIIHYCSECDYYYDEGDSVIGGEGVCSITDEKIPYLTNKYINSCPLQDFECNNNCNGCKYQETGKNEICSYPDYVGYGDVTDEIDSFLCGTVDECKYYDGEKMKEEKYPQFMKESPASKFIDDILNNKKQCNCYDGEPAHMVNLNERTNNMINLNDTNKIFMEKIPQDKIDKMFAELRNIRDEQTCDCIDKECNIPPENIQITTHSSIEDQLKHAKYWEKEWEKLADSFATDADNVAHKHNEMRESYNAMREDLMQEKKRNDILMQQNTVIMEQNTQLLKKLL